MVKEGTEKATGKTYALKIMKKVVVQDNNLMREVEIMKQLEHTNIILLKEIFESDTELILVLELYVPRNTQPRRNTARRSRSNILNPIII